MLPISRTMSSEQDIEDLNEFFATLAVMMRLMFNMNREIQDGSTKELIGNNMQPNWCMKIALKGNI